MKKRVLSILLCLCMVLMLCPVTAFADDYRTVTLNFKYGTFCRAVDEPSPYVLSIEIGDLFNLGHVEDCAPYEFVGWKESVSGTVYEPDTEINVNPDNDLTFDAVYQVQGSLAITVDGFEVGNTPADCTYSFESTIPGVTFSEDDIQNVPWVEFVFDGSDYVTNRISNTDVFEADTRYRVGICLDNKGLATAPAVTVNGKTPEDCLIATRNGVPIQLQIFCTLGTPPMPPLTIDGPDVVCAQQDYEFTVTPADGVTLDTEFGYDTGMKGGGADLTVDADGVGHGVVSAEWYDLQTNRFTLTARGTDPGGNTVPGTKTVEVSPEHIYVDGVCGCGAVQQYTVTYDGGEDSDPVTDVKTHGKDLTLRSKTFTMDGFVQTGWVDKEGAVYKLGATYTADQDVTLYPVFEKLITLTVPFTTTVALGDAGEPGETTFELALIDGSGAALTADNVTAAAAVTTDGAGDYTGALTITGPERQLWYMLSEGAFVRQVDAGEAGWTVDDTVWGVLMEEIPVAYAMGDDAIASGYTAYVVPASIDGNGYYYIDWENLETADMRFTNTYTAHVYALKHDATHHWDECAGCKDVQNKEPHKYGDWKVTKEATQTAKGEKEHTCTVCGYTEKAEIPMRTNVPTGDDSSFALWAALFTLSAAAVTATATMGKRKKAGR